MTNATAAYEKAYADYTAARAAAADVYMAARAPKNTKLDTAIDINGAAARAYGSAIDAADAAYRAADRDARHANAAALDDEAAAAIAAYDAATTKE